MTTGTLSLNQGDYFYYSDRAIDLQNNSINLSGKSGIGYIKIKVGDSGILDQFNFNIIDTGNYSISLNPSNTSAYPVGRAFYGVYIYNSGLNSNPYQAQVAQGYIDIFPEMVSNFTGLYTGVNTGSNNNCCGNIDGGSF